MVSHRTSEKRVRDFKHHRRPPGLLLPIPAAESESESSTSLTTLHVLVIVICCTESAFFHLGSSLNTYFFRLNLEYDASWNKGAGWPGTFILLTQAAIELRQLHNTLSGRFTRAENLLDTPFKTAGSCEDVSEPQAIMASSKRPAFQIDLGNVPSIVPNPSSPARSIASPVASPGLSRLQAAGASLGGLGLGELRSGAGSPSREAGSSRFYPRRYVIERRPWFQTRTLTIDIGHQDGVPQWSVASRRPYVSGSLSRPATRTTLSRT